MKKLLKTQQISPTQSLKMSKLFFIKMTEERHDDEILKVFNEALANLPEVEDL